MKTIKIILVLLFLTLPVLAQEETLFEGKFENGGFGGPGIKVTQLDKTTGLLVGGSGAWIINHTIGIGGGGYGLVSSIKINALDGQDFRMQFGYGGLILEYIYNSNNLIHFTAQTLIGGGSISWIDNDRYQWNNDYLHNTYGKDEFFVFEPGVNVEFNLVKWFRVDVGVNYRLISGLDSKLTYLGNTMKTLSSKDLSGVSGSVTFKFGVF
jgi:hypothetical protein